MKFYRIQEAGISFKEMQNYTSADGGDGYDFGLCASSSPDGRDGGQMFGGAWEAYDDEFLGEVVVMEGDHVQEIYDGYRIHPTKEIARFSKADWEKMLADGSAYKFED